MTWLANNWAMVADALWAHLMLAIPPIILSFLISVPLGALANKFRPIRMPLITFTSLLYAIPSLPLLIVIPLLIGVNVRSSANVIVTLTLYGIALMVRSAADALDASNSDAIHAATAMGYSPIKRFFAVDLPLAGPALLAGLRVVAVSTVALVTVSAVLGTHNLGTLFTDGFQRGITAEVITGIVLTVLLAWLIDRALVGIGWLALPWLRGSTKQPAKAVELA